MSSIDISLDELMKAKIKNALDDYLILEKKIDDIPDKLQKVFNQIHISLVKSINDIPSQLDKKLQNRINAIESIAVKLDEEAQKEAEALKKKIRLYAEEATAKLNIQVAETLRELSWQNIQLRHPRPIWHFALVGLLCVIGAGVAGFAGMGLQYQRKVLLLEQKVTEYLHHSNANHKGALEVIASLPPNKKEQAKTVYEEARSKDFYNQTQKK